MNSVLKKLCVISRRLLELRKSLPTPFRKAQKIASNQGICTDIVWMDLEMTGLDVEEDKIMEISCVVTDASLNIKAEGPCFAINYPENCFQNMTDWCAKHHTESGLVDKCLKSEITIDTGEQLILDFLKQFIPKKSCPLAGNSIYIDRLFLRKYMPSVDDYLHYRVIDVSTIKECAKRWNPKLLNTAPQKKFAHRSLDDIYESIAELKFYRQTFFNILDDGTVS